MWIADEPSAVDQPAYPRFAIAGTCAVFFFLLYYVLHYGLSALLFGEVYSRQSKKTRIRWDERSIAVLHAVVATVLSVAYVLSHPLDVDHIGNTIFYSRATPWLRQLCLEMTIGYFVSDVLRYVTLTPDEHGLPDYLHHIVAVASYSAGVFWSWGTMTMILFETNECSTPFLHLKWFLEVVELQRSTLYSVNLYVFYALFFLGRIVFNGYVSFICYVTLRDKVPPTDVSYALVMTQLGLTISHVVLQVYWMYLLSVIAYRRLTGQHMSKSKTI